MEKYVEGEKSLGAMKKPLGEIVKMLRESKHLSQSEIVQGMRRLGCDYTEASLSRFERGTLGIGPDKMRVLCKVLGVAVSEVYSLAELGAELDLTIPGEDNEASKPHRLKVITPQSSKRLTYPDTPTRESWVSITYIESPTAATGETMQDIVQTSTETIILPKTITDMVGRPPEALVAVHWASDNMAPRVPAGSTVLIDPDVGKVEAGKIYLINHDGLVRLVLLYPRPGGGLRIGNANIAEYPEEILPKGQAEEDVVLLGRVVFLMSTM